jgi:hypothetical protein
MPTLEHLADVGLFDKTWRPGVIESVKSPNK